MGRGRRFLALALLLAGVAGEPTLKACLRDPEIYMEPTYNIFVEEGSTLNITCLLNGQNQTRLPDVACLAVMSPQGHLFSAEDQSRVTAGEDWIRAEFTNVTLQDSGRYNCVQRCDNTIRACIQVTVGARPPQPTVTRVVWRGQKELTVTLDVGRSDLGVPTNYSVVAPRPVFMGSPPLQLPCRMGDTGCQCGPVELLSSDNLNLTAVASNVFGNTTSSLVVSVKDLVEPEAVPEQDVALEAGNQSARVEWGLPGYLDFLSSNCGGLLYQLTVCPQSPPPSACKDFLGPQSGCVQRNITCPSDNSSQEEKCLKLNATLKGLSPYTDYQLCLRSKPLRGGYWSKPTAKVFSTQQSAPLSAPQLWPWSYSLPPADRTSLELVIYRSVVPSSSLGAPNASFRAQLLKSGVIRTWPSHSLALPLPGVDVIQDNVSVTSFTTNPLGRSPPGPTLVVPARDEAPAAPAWLDMEVGKNGQLLLFWDGGQRNPPVQTVVTSQTLSDQEMLPLTLNCDFSTPGDPEPEASVPHVRLHWCCEPSLRTAGELTYFANCSGEEPLKSELTTVPLERGHASVPVPTAVCSERKSLRVGVSVERSGVSSGIVWNSCLFSAEAESAPSVQLSPRVTSDGTLTVSWPFTCDLDSDFPKLRPLGYELALSDPSDTTSGKESYQCDQASDLRNVKLHDAHHVSFGKLQPGAGYSVCIRALTDRGPGEWNSPVQIPVRGSETPSVSLVLIVSLVVVVVVLFALALVICSTVRKCKKRKRMEIRHIKPAKDSSQAYFNMDETVNPVQLSEPQASSDDSLEEKITYKCSDEDETASFPDPVADQQSYSDLEQDDQNKYMLICGVDIPLDTIQQ